MKLVLFDIDGTLLSAGGAGRRAIERALVEVFGSAGPAEHRFDGKTDPQIVRELMRRTGHDDARIDADMRKVLARYAELLPQELSAGVAPAPGVYPGVRELLDVLAARADVVLGLLTGNVREGASAKLRAVGLDPERFRVGAFGSDHETRGQLPAIAVQRAREQLGADVTGDDVVVIGDTPADIACGASIGVRAIGVATGHYSVDELAACHPAAVFRDLSDTAAAVRAIMGEAAHTSANEHSRAPGGIRA
jgi:phosphoglycolate phosphatase-like HAD superfamily hydrolase